MYQITAAGGRYWSSNQEPRWLDWRGRQAYKYRFARPGQASHAAK